MKQHSLVTLLFYVAAQCAVAQLNDYVYLTADSLHSDNSFSIVPASVVAIEARAALPKKSGPQPAWGLQWNCTDSTYSYVMLHIDSDSPDDIDLRQQATISVGYNRNGTDSIIHTHTTVDGFDFSSGYNSIAVQWAGDALTISGGNRHCDPLFTLPEFGAPIFPGCRFVAAPDVNLECIVVEQSSAATNLDTQSGDMTTEQLNKRFAMSTDPIEGYWEHFDMQADYDNARPGGTYRLAIVRSDTDTYNILYISGARTNAPAWHPLMLKGQLIFTPFRNNFTLQWYDSMLQPVDPEIGANATLENARLLTLRFPRLGMTLRLSKNIPN